MNFHVTLNSIREDLLKGTEESVLFTAEQLAAYMHQWAQLAAAEGMFHQDEADHEDWVLNLGVVLQRPELQLSHAGVTQDSSAKVIRAAWVSILGYICEFEDFHCTKKWRWWDSRDEFHTRFHYLLCDINRVAHGVGSPTMVPGGKPAAPAGE